MNPQKQETTLAIRLLTLIHFCLLFVPAVVLADRPNIVFVLVDDHAWEAVSAYGSYLQDFASTPTIDRLGTEGMRLDNFVCANSICSPSRASFITGQYSHVNGVKNLNGEINLTSPWLSEGSGPQLIVDDGGDVELISYAGGVARLALRGACAGCPASELTLRAQIERRLRVEFPDLVRVEQG